MTCRRRPTRICRGGLYGGEGERKSPLSMRPTDGEFSLTGAANFSWNRGPPSRKGYFTRHREGSDLFNLFLVRRGIRPCSSLKSTNSPLETVSVLLPIFLELFYHLCAVCCIPFWLEIFHDQSTASKGLFTKTFLSLFLIHFFN